MDMVMGTDMDIDDDWTRAVITKKVHNYMYIDIEIMRNDERLEKYNLT
jgi:hypothetical protein